MTSAVSECPSCDHRVGINCYAMILASRCQNLRAKVAIVVLQGSAHITAGRPALHQSK